MSRLWTPPGVDRKLKDQTAEHTAGVMRMVQRFHGHLSYWTDALRREFNDDGLEMIFAPPNATAAGLMPGRYHVMKVIPGDPPALFPVLGPEGEFIEPSWAVINKMKEQDLWSTRAVREQRRRQEAEEQARERQQQREDDDRREELRDRAKAAWATSVSMSDAAPWTQTMHGRRGRKRS